MIIFMIVGCGSSEELTELEDQQIETPAEMVDEEVDDNETTNVDSSGTELTDIEERKLKAAENELKLKFQQEANNITHLYVTAQQLFYNGNSEQALTLIQQADDIRDNADVKALKGSIYLSLGYRVKFEQNWKRALELDKDVPIPPIPYIKQELKNLGLID